MLAAIFHVSLPFGMAGKCGMSSAHLWSFLLCEMHQEAQRKKGKKNTNWQKGTCCQMHRKKTIVLELVAHCLSPS